MSSRPTSERADSEDRGPPPCLARGRGHGAVAADRTRQALHERRGQLGARGVRADPRTSREAPEPAQGGGLAPFRRGSAGEAGIRRRSVPSASVLPHARGRPRQKWIRHFPDPTGSTSRARTSPAWPSASGSTSASGAPRACGRTDRAGHAPSPDARPHPQTPAPEWRESSTLRGLKALPVTF